MHRVNSAGPSGTGLAARAQPRRDPPRHVIGRQEHRVVGVDDEPQWSHRAAERSSDSIGPAADPQCRWHSCSSHSPLTLRR
jgi:hypothetical protein